MLVFIIFFSLKKENVISHFVLTYYNKNTWTGWSICIWRFHSVYKDNQTKMVVLKTTSSFNLFLLSSVDQQHGFWSLMEICYCRYFLWYMYPQKEAVRGEMQCTKQFKFWFFGDQKDLKAKKVTKERLMSGSLQSLENTGMHF